MNENKGRRFRGWSWMVRAAGPFAMLGLAACAVGEPTRHRAQVASALESSELSSLVDESQSVADEVFALTGSESDYVVLGDEEVTLRAVARMETPLEGGDDATCMLTAETDVVTFEETPAEAPMPSMSFGVRIQGGVPVVPALEKLEKALVDLEKAAGLAEREATLLEKTLDKATVLARRAAAVLRVLECEVKTASAAVDRAKVATQLRNLGRPDDAAAVERAIELLARYKAAGPVEPWVATLWSNLQFNAGATATAIESLAKAKQLYGDNVFLRNALRRLELGRPVVLPPVRSEVIK